MKPAPENSVLTSQRPGFVRYVRSLLGNRRDVDAEDVVQDVLVSVVRTTRSSRC